MTWWRDRSQSTSWSLVSLTVCLVLLAGLGLSQWLPERFRDSADLARPAPGLLTVAPAARGEITLGAGFTAGMFASGIHVARQDQTIIDTITSAGFVAAVRGSVDGQGEQRKEVIGSALTNVRIDSVEIAEATATWRGVVYAQQPADGLPLTITARRTASTVWLTLTVPSVDALFVHLDVRPNTVGIAPQLPPRNLRQRGWWIEGGGTPLFTDFRSATASAKLGMGPGAATRAIDVRPDGYLTLHTWAPSVTFDLSLVPVPVPAPTVGS